MYGPPPSQQIGVAPFVAPVSPYPNNLNSSQSSPPYPPVGMDSPSATLFSAGALGPNVPTAPSSDMFGPVPGYEGMNTGDNGGSFLPPPPPALIPSPAQPSPENAEWTLEAKEVLDAHPGLPNESLVLSLRGETALPGISNSRKIEENGTQELMQVGVEPYVFIVSSNAQRCASLDTINTIPNITEDAAKEAFLQYARESCCYGTSPAQEMVFKEFTPFNTYRYHLETFTEARAFDWQIKPFDGETADLGVYGPPPQPWDIPVSYPTLFKDDEKKMPVPGTSSVKTCPQCMSTGKTVCTRCAGTGQVQCTWCHGSGHCKGDEQCSSCNGHGTESCRSCRGAMECCHGCSGKGKVVNYIQLTVTWKNYIFEFFADHNSDFPTDLFKKVTGEKLFTDEQHLVPPLVTFPKQSINKASQDGQKEHYYKFSSTSRILRQRQAIELLPLSKVNYTWKDTPYSYFVYGTENKVYTTNYPQKCCCILL